MPPEQPQTSPLAKAIHTLEGKLIVASEAVMAIVAFFDPSKLPPKTAAIVIGASNIALLVQRGVIKVQAMKWLNNIVDSPDPVKTAEEELFGEVNAPISPTDPPPPGATKPDLAEEVIKESAEHPAGKPARLRRRPMPDNPQA